MRFANREDAARRLADALAEYRGSHPLVLAIPRGAVPMGRVVADALDGQLDVVLVRKLAAPTSPELAIGAVDETGWTWTSPHARALGVDPGYLERERARQLETIARRRREITPTRPPIDPRGRTVIVVDDGLATGATMLAALHSVRARGAAKVVCAVPVAAPDSLALVMPEADDVVCLHAPQAFYAVGQFYDDFRQVEDAEVLALLA